MSFMACSQHVPFVPKAVIETMPLRAGIHTKKKAVWVGRWLGLLMLCVALANPLKVMLQGTQIPSKVESEIVATMDRLAQHR